MPEPIVIKEGAIFIADSHENENRKNFLRFLYSLKSGEIKTPQLFLMGDMFDFLAAQCEFFVKFYEPYIDVINEISKKTEIYYFEGNHDFNLARLFKNVKAYPIGAQPVKFATECGQSVLIAHGDIFLFTYRVLFALVIVPLDDDVSLVKCVISAHFRLG